MDNITGVTLTQPTNEGGDGIVCCDGNSWVIKNCVVDFSGVDLENQDELLSVTWNSQASVENVTLKNGKKAFLCGSGDDCEHTDVWRSVSVKDTVIENCGRRCPEAQDKYFVRLENCVIKNWGRKEVFDVRCFGAWAHHGGRISCVNCRFEQDSFWQTGFINFFRDLANHIGQAYNYRGIKALFNWKTYLPGVMRGAIATDGGHVECYNCAKNKWWIYLENNN